MTERPRLALSHVFLLTLAGLTALLGVLFYLTLAGSRRSILESSERLRESASLRIATRVEDYLYQAQKAIEDVEAQIHAGALRPDDPERLESGLFAEVLGNPNLSEVTLTHASLLGRSADGEALLADGGRWQVSVFRRLGPGGGEIRTRLTRPRGGGFDSDIREPLQPRGGRDEGEVADPTRHLTFRTPASEAHYGEVLWTDLHPSELDSHLPEEQRRVVVTVMKAVADGQGRFVGVLRAGLLTEQLDAATRLRVNEGDPHDPHRVFLCDERGRLVTRLGPADRLADVGGDLRFLPAAPPAELAAALGHAALAGVGPSQPWASGDLLAAGRRYYVTFRRLARTQGWRVGIVVPEDYYLGDLQQARNRLLAASAAVMAVILALGALTVRAVRRGFGEIVQATARMRAFDFAPAAVGSPFREVAEVMDGLERAKTAMRAMGKYVPIDLVRQQYETKQEPVLGGEPREVSIMFTDIKDFTSLAERVPVAELGPLLGRYLEVMTGAIHETRGVIDKYIGDAVMALWNAPSPCPDHARSACRAALGCVAATRSLFESPEWAGRPAIETRFGLNRDLALVGHFGAPDRMSYTALGDGVNLASRLEGLNKIYGTSILVSAAVREAAGDEFAFRLLDAVAVKGKTQGVCVYELIGPKGADAAREAAAAVYEQAYGLYRERRFAEAEALLETQPADPPSRALRERCRRFRDMPPPSDWDGIFVSMAK